MTNKIETFIDALMVEVAGVSGDSSKSTSPYYRYGMKWFDTEGGVPPQIRFQPQSFQLTRLQQNQTSNNISYGSNGIIEQNVQCTIWGSTESQVWDELHYLLQAYTNIKSAGDNPLNVTQESLLEELTGDWVDTSAKSIKGEMITFNFRVRFNVPSNLSGSTNLRTITSQSMFVTGSDEVPVVSGSSVYEGLKGFRVLSGSSYS
jgi:hypothetical protein